MSRGAGKEASGAGGRGKGKNSVGSNSNTSIFNFADTMGEGNAHMARLLVLYLYNQEKVAPVGPLGCVQLRCSTYDRTYFTPVPFVECLDTRAVLSLDTGRLFVRTKSGLTVFFDMKRCIWRSAEFSWPLISSALTISTDSAVGPKHSQTVARLSLGGSWGRAGKCVRGGTGPQCKCDFFF